jgi:hypothetical protein
MDIIEASDGGTFFNAHEPIGQGRQLSMTRGSVEGVQMVALYIDDDDAPVFLPEELMRRVLGSDPKAEQN